MSDGSKAFGSDIAITERERLDGTLSTENHRLATLLLRTRGYVVLHHALPIEFVARLRLAFSDVLQTCLHRRDPSNSKPREVEGAVFWERKYRLRIFPKLVAPFSDPILIANSFVSPILETFLGHDYCCKFVSSDTCMKGAILQSPHRDIEFYNGQSPQGYFVNVPLMECGLHNGPLEVWPGGSHLWDAELFERYQMAPFVQDDRNGPIEDFVERFNSEKVVLSPGTILVRDPGMWHRGTPNPTDEPRTMLTMGMFRRSYSFDYEAPFYNLNEDSFNALDQRVKRRFDYAFHWNSLLYWKQKARKSFRRSNDMRQRVS